MWACLVLTLVAAQSIQPLPLGSMFINTSPSTKSGKMSCGGEEKGKLGRVVRSLRGKVLRISPMG